MPALPPYKRQIYTLLSILSAGIISALLLVGFLVYNFGPKGNYLVTHAILEPKLVKNLNYSDTNNKTGGMSRFVYDSIVFDYYDAKGKPHQIEVTQDKYNQLYQLIHVDSSILQVPESIIAEFNNSLINALSIRVRTESPAAWQDEKKLFQEMQFSPKSNHYRVKLRTDPTTQQWIYFNHPDITQQTLQLFTQ